MEVDNPCTYTTRRRERRLLPFDFSRTKINSTSIEIILRKGYHLMKECDLIPENLNDLSKQQVKNWFKKISDTLVVGTMLKKIFHLEYLCQITPSCQYIFNRGHNFFVLTFLQKAFPEFYLVVSLGFLIYSPGQRLASQTCKTSFSVLIEYI